MTEALLEVIGQWTAMAKDSLYDGQVSPIRCSHEKDFVLEKDGCAYVYVHDLPLLGPKDVVAAYESTDEDHALLGLTRKVKAIHWLDNDEELLFSQNGDQCSYRAVGFPYGTHWIVRVAKVDFE